MLTWHIFLYFTGYAFSVLVSGDVHKSAELEPSLEDKLSATAERSDGPPQLVNPTTANGYCAKRNRADKAGKYECIWYMYI